MVVLAGGCVSYSPPVRTLGYGAPGRLRQGDVEVGGGVAGAGAPLGGGGWLGYGVRDWAAVEVGAQGSGASAMGFLGGRFTYAPRRDHKLHGALDAEVGVGVGAGGEPECGLWQQDCDRRRWYDRAAFGAYAGGGAGYHFSFFSLYARGRAQPSVADGLPGTLWGQAQGGLQFRIARKVDLFSSVGMAGLVNRVNHLETFMWDAGISVHFGARGGRRTARMGRGPRLRR